MVQQPHGSSRPSVTDSGSVGLHRPRGRPRRAGPPHVQGLPDGTSLRQVPLSDINRSDTSLQLRLGTGHGDLRPSLAAEGQQVPVLLCGSRPPYRIVDGFRRIEALAALGWPTAWAIVRDDLDDSRAFALSFIENVRRRSFSPIDKAHAVWQAIHVRRMKMEEVSGALGLSVRQVERYLELLSFPDELRKAVRSQRLSMAHAVVLHQARAHGFDNWMRVVAAEGLSAKQLKGRLARLSRRGRPALFIRERPDGFRIYPMKYDSATDEAKAQRMLQALELAVRTLKAGLRQSTGAGCAEARSGPLPRAAQGPRSVTRWDDA